MDEDPLRSYLFGGDDNPDFIEGLFAWVRANEVEATVLFEFYNGGQGDTVDHTLLPSYWNSPLEKRPRVSFYPKESEWSRFTDLLHPRASQAYSRILKEK